MPTVLGALSRALILPLAAASAVALLAPLARADVTGDAIQSANIQPTIDAHGKVLGLESGQAKGVYCDLTHSGFNAVTLDIPLLQTSKTGTKIAPRPAGPGTSPTPTDAQLRQAVRNARKCGLKVILKPHLELPGGEWRAHIKGNARWQAAWEKVLLRYAKIARQEHATTLVIGTEQKGATLPKGSTSRWKHTVGVLRKAAPGLRLTYAAHTNDEALLLGPSFVRKLDYLSLTWYPRPPKGLLTVATLEADMRLDKPRYFDKARERYGKRIVFAETGFRSIDMRDYYAKGDEPRRPSMDVQAMQYEAMLRFLDSVPYVDGVMLYRVYNHSDAGGAGDAGFSWQNKPAAEVVERYFVR